MDRSEISMLNSILKSKQDLFKYYQFNQELLKRKHDLWDIYTNETYSKNDFQMDCQKEMSQNKYMLRKLQKEIIELRSKIKKIQRKQNG